MRMLYILLLLATLTFLNFNTAYAGGENDRFLHVTRSMYHQVASLPNGGALGGIIAVHQDFNCLSKITMPTSVLGKPASGAVSIITNHYGEGTFYYQKTVFPQEFAGYEGSAKTIKVNNSATCAETNVNLTAAKDCDREAAARELNNNSFCAAVDRANPQNITACLIVPREFSDTICNPEPVSPNDQGNFYYKQESANNSGNCCAGKRLNGSPDRECYIINACRKLMGQ